MNKIQLEGKTIEIYNNWIGVQSVFVNNQIVSKKYSFTKSEHNFSLFEDGQEVPYTLIVKVSSKEQLLKSDQVIVDILKNGKTIKKDLFITFAKKQKRERNKNKIKGIDFLKEYEIDQAIEALQKGLEIDDHDPEIFFYLACCYSIKEETKKSFEFIKKAVENNLNDREMILNHEMLSYIRIQDGFEQFSESDFTNL